MGAPMKEDKVFLGAPETVMGPASRCSKDVAWDQVIWKQHR